MTRRHLAIVILGALAIAPGAALAQPSVEVAVGPAVQVRQDELGRSELDGQRRYLQDAVARAAAHGTRSPTAVRLVIEDIEPTRPTPAELAASPSLQAASSGLGGAAVTGEVTTQDGRRLPIRFRDFPPDRRDQVDFTTWGDADEAFDELAAAIAAGRAPNDPSSWPPPHRARTPTGTRIPG